VSVAGEAGSVRDDEGSGGAEGRIAFKERKSLAVKGGGVNRLEGGFRAE
jgi:hypothetical protein